MHAAAVSGFKICNYLYDCHDCFLMQLIVATINKRLLQCVN